jgi:hypothetical protein
MGAMKLWDGTTWQTVAPFSEHASCYVGPDAPAGTANAGDLWWDTDDPTIAYPGAELAYNQITAQVNITATTEASPSLIIEGTSRVYDGSPVIIDCYLPSIHMANCSQIVFNMWDGGTDLGRVGAAIVSGNGFMTHLCTKRRLTPTVGTHNYRLLGWIPVGTGAGVFTGSGANAYNPGIIRVTRV